MRRPGQLAWRPRTTSRFTSGVGGAGGQHAAVSRIWRAFALQPHRVESFKLSKDPLFIEKVRDIVGLYLRPPDKALVFCVDEKAQMQALDRSQPLLPLQVLDHAGVMLLFRNFRTHSRVS